MVYKKYNLVYIDCTCFYSKIQTLIFQNYGNNLKKTDLKKLIFHYLITDLLLTSKIKRSKEKPIFFFCSDSFESNTAEYCVEFLKVLKLLKSYLPVPVLVIKNMAVLKEESGHFKGLNEKISNFYIKRNHNINKLKKYLKNEEYYELINILGEPKHIKTLIN